VEEDVDISECERRRPMVLPGDCVVSIAWNCYSRSAAFKSVRNLNACSTRPAQAKPRLSPLSYYQRGNQRGIKRIPPFMKVKEVLFGVAGLAKLDWFITGNERTFRRRSSVADFQKRI
jgi:hypothetical protein